MSLFDRFRRKPVVVPTEEKYSRAGPAISYVGVGQPVWSKRDQLSFFREAYAQNPIAYRCIKMIAGNAATVPMLLFDGDGNEIEKHELLDLLRRPNGMTTGTELLEAFYIYLQTCGNAYMECVGPSTQTPKELWIPRADRMKILPGQFGIPRQYEYEWNGIKKSWYVDQRTGDGLILHIKDFNPLDDWYGMSRLEAAAWSVDRHNKAQAYNKALLDNGARPSGALVFEPVSMGNGVSGSAPPEVIQQAEAALEMRHMGPENSGRPMVLGGNVKWIPLGMTERDMDFMEGKQDAARDICSALGVPFVLLVPGQSTYNNLKEAKLELWESTVLPLLYRIIDALNSWLAPRFGEGLRLEPDLDEISALEPRREAKRASIKDLIDTGIISDDEARYALQYEARGEGAVKKADPNVIAALTKSAEVLGPTALYNYMMDRGLLKPGDTMEQLIAQAVKPAEPETPAPTEEDVSGTSTQERLQ